TAIRLTRIGRPSASALTGRPSAQARSGAPSRSCVLRRDRLDRVGDVVALVDDALDDLLDLLAVDVAKRIDRTGLELRAQASESLVERRVGSVLDRTDFLAERDDRLV